jgi:hypothetical protein
VASLKRVHEGRSVQLSCCCNIGHAAVCLFSSLHEGNPSEVTRPTSRFAKVVCRPVAAICQTGPFIPRAILLLHTQQSAGGSPPEANTHTHTSHVRVVNTRRYTHARTHAAPTLAWPSATTCTRSSVHLRTLFPHSRAALGTRVAKRGGHTHAHALPHGGKPFCAHILRKMSTLEIICAGAWDSPWPVALRLTVRLKAFGPVRSSPRYLTSGGGRARECQQRWSEGRRCGPR